LALLILSFAGTDDNWKCEIESSNNSNLDFKINPLKEALTFVRKLEEP